MANPVVPRELLRRLTIQTKLSGVILALVAVIVVPFSIVRTTRPVREQAARLHAKAQLYDVLASRALGAPLAPDGAKAARQVVQSMSLDPDVRAVGLYAADGTLVEGRGLLQAGEPPPAVPSPRVTHAGRMVRALIPVTTAEGMQGTLIVELAGDALEGEQSAALRSAMMMGGGALTLGLLAAWLIGRSFARRVRAVSEQASAVAAGDLSRRPLQDQSSDEIGQMARAFKRMVERIRTLIAQIKESAKKEADRLEMQVAERTAQLDQRNTEMRLVLDNVDQGFVTLDRAGWLSQMCSRVVETWLGPPMPRVPFADWMFRGDAEQLALFELGWDALIEGALPRELLLEQLPRRVEVNGRTLAIAYRPIEKAGTRAVATPAPGPAFDRTLVRMLVVITDVSGELARVRAEEGQRELASVMERYGRDRTAALTFFEEARASCARIVADQIAGEDLLRALHTLKGNARLMGITSFSSVCHQLESGMVAEGCLCDDDRARLRGAWDETEQRIGFLLGANDKIEIAETDFAAVLRAVDDNASRGDLLRMLAACRAESITARLEYFADQARRMAESLGKLPIEVAIEAGDLSLPRGALGEFWSAFVHVIRNAVDHGLEATADRLASAKPAIRRLVLRARVAGDAFWLEVEDDGRGVAWETIRARALATGLPALTREDLVRALCAGGVSTRTEISELSGRGVGMTAVRSACTATAGALEIQSEPGRGTVMRFRWAAKGLGLLDTGARDQRRLTTRAPGEPAAASPSPSPRPTTP